MRLVKICGNRTFEDTAVSINQGADYIGFIFSSESRRQVKANDVGRWMEAFQKEMRPKLVGVFVHPTIQFLEDVLAAVELDCIQLHGDEDEEFVKQVKEKFGLSVWKALPHHEHVIEGNGKNFRVGWMDM